MSTLDTMMRLQAGYNGQEMEGINQLSQTLGRIIQGGGQRDYRAAAVKFFADKDITPQSIQEFSAMYPGVDPMEAFQMAGVMAKEKKAQKMKDAFKTIQSYARSARESGQDFDAGKLAELMPDMDPEMIPLLQQFKQLHPEVKLVDLQPGHRVQKTIGGNPVGAPMEGPPVAPGTEQVTLYGPNGQTIRVPVTKGQTLVPPKGWTLQAPSQATETPLDKAVKDKMRQTNPATGQPYTASEAYREVAHPQQSKLLTPEEEAQQIRIAQEKRPPRKPAVPKETTSADLSRLGSMIQKATDGREPTETEIAIIGTAADKAGYEFKKLTGKTAGYGLPGIDKVLWGGNEISEWRLVPKKAGGGLTPGAATKKLIGTKDGKPVYDIGGGKWQIGGE